MNKGNSITIGELVKDLASSPIPLELAAKEVKGIGLDHRQIKKDWVFIALRGTKEHGLRFVSQFKEELPLAILLDEKDEIRSREAEVIKDKKISVIRIKDLASRVAELGMTVYKTEDLQWIGVTGTNGKSSIVHILGTCLNKLGASTAVVGTVYNGFPSDPQPNDTNLTTPDALSLRRYGYEFGRKGAQYVVTECSSHGLSQKRIDGLNMFCAVFTNLSRDHLDYHKNMRDYEKSKYRLFQYSSVKYGVINIGDSVGAKWYKEIKDNISCLSYGTKGADIFAEDIKICADESSAMVSSPRGKGKLRVKTYSSWGISNSLASLGVMLHLKFEFQDCMDALAQVEPLAGRMQRISNPDKADFIVDYAHSPEALKLTLASAREQLRPSAKLWLVFGCGGERDKDKRRIMGEIADKYADNIVLTNDNPRQEDPRAIIEDIMKGIRRKDLVVLQERSDALQFALATAEPNDLVLVAGKGHETYQETMGVKRHFNDYDFINERIKGIS